MKQYSARFKFLVNTYLVSLLVFTFARILFFLFNKSRLVGIAGSDFFQSLLHGFRFDVVASTAINSLFIMLVIFPFSLFYKKWFRLLLKFVFILGNSLGLIANLIDTAYFTYTLKRSTPDTFSFFFTKNDAGTLLPVFIKDFWHLFLIFFITLFCLVRLYIVIERKYLFPFLKEKNSVKQIVLKSICFLLITGISVLGIRGGTQLIPISIIDAGDGVKPSCIPLVLNTPFCLIKSGVLYTLDEKKYMSDAEAEKLVDPIKKYNYTNDAFKKLNVVVIILESFSKEYTQLGKRKSYTPFLDSLMNNSLVYINAFANGKRSIEGIPAILSSVPSFQFDYISTVYSNNQLNSLASILKTKGYYSSFFHGGTNGTMNFNGYCATAGFDSYFGRTQYNNEADYDGNWGIWDEPFLQRMATELDKQPQPFISSVFTLSSHHPYSIPDTYKTKFPEGKYPIQKCIAYTDYALKQFFETAEKQKWFNNTLFVVTADHTGMSDDAVYANSYGTYQIPLFFYLPNNSLKGVNKNVAQQIDIMPTVLDILNYNNTFFSFGNNVKDTSATNFALNYANNNYQYFSGNNMLQFNGNNSVGLYNYKTDTTLAHNILSDSIALKTKLETLAKAFIQQYNNKVIHNQTSVK